MTPTRQLKILMIHGYTETGETFRADNVELEHALRDAFPAAPAPGYHPSYPGGIQFVYPTGTWRLKPTDWARYIPGTDPNYGWFYKVPDDEEFPGLTDGLAHLGDVMKTQGPFTGVIGYSQGGFIAGLIASLLEPGRREAFQHFVDQEDGIPYPEAFRGVEPIRFSISCCGFAGLSPRYKAFYSPKISSPLLHINGALDLQVDDKRSRTLVDATAGEEEEKVLLHPGAHIIPTKRLYTDAMIAWIKRQLVPVDCAKYIRDT
ncbi:hypothetical protein K431DRAFT_236294 [Polychaeton citri CBS 116435]|uniref:Serine hydrolase domain-containing protein n=1 Tax=Polychaeton citri CBS 116435 TaxID=1314669 RepID=A0A9P4PY92_9PEZI|nr:hypothetical protein K431DRAFT_236294 [Polychaeton citri CBS 116435]